MRSTLGITGSWALALAMLFAPSAISAESQNERPQRNEKKMHDNLVKEARHQLLLLPYYSVFDNLLYKVDGDKVTLMGQVVRPTLKNDAENVVSFSCDLRRHGAVALWNVRVAFDSHHCE